MTTTYTEPVRAQIAGHPQRYVSPAATTAGQSDAHVAPLVRQRFTVANERVELQASAWRDYVARSVDVPISRVQVANGFHGEIDTYVLDGLAYLDIRTDPVIQIRTAQKISNDTVRDFVFHVVIDGIVETTTGSPRARKSLQFVPGILALDMGQPLRMERPTASRILAFFVPRATVDAYIADADSIHGTVLAYTSPLARLAREQVSALAHALPHLGQVDAAGLVRNCAELVMAAFAKQTRLGRGARAAARTAAFDRVKRHIDGNLHSDALSPESVLNQFNISRPTLYRMFEGDGGLHAYIRHCRLREAALELIRFPRMAITEIAYGLGFNSHSDFTRAFRRVYGLAPQDYRFEMLLDSTQR